MQKKKLSKEQYHILCEQGTEIPFTGKYWHNTKNGMYLCAQCGNKLFSSATKFESGTGWPSFWKPIEEKSVKEKKDTGHLMQRTEVVCSKCGGHLGHVFNDGPQPTGQRYCINSLALTFKEKKGKKK